MPPRIGSDRWMVEEGAILSEDRVEEVVGEVVKCLPAYTRRSSDGETEVRSERSCLRVVIVVDEGMVRGMTRDRLASVLGVGKGDVVLSPERSLTNI